MHRQIRLQLTLKMSEFFPRAGAVRFQSDGEWICANPHDVLYSTVTMSATEFFNGDLWMPIYSDVEID